MEFIRLNKGSQKVPGQEGKPMFRSYKVFEIFGVEVKIHGTLAAVLAVFLGVTLVSQGVFAAGHMALLIAMIMACVTLHELGHIGAAAIFGIGTTGLTLYPIGGIARLTREARSSLEEVVVALAGPLVNVILASFASLALVLSGGGLSSLLGTMVLINVVMAVFNLVPAYPMDGGRIFRGVLWKWLGKRKATLWAARGGQIFAVLFAITGLFLGHTTLFLIGIFIYFQASAEHKRAELTMAPERPKFLVESAGQSWIEGREDNHESYGAEAGGRSVIIRTPFGTFQRWEF
jgi:Zn-dependent protease